MIKMAQYNNFSAGRELIKSGNFRECYTTSDYVLVDDGTIKRVNISYRNIKYVPMPPLPPEKRTLSRNSRKKSMTALTINIEYAGKIVLMRTEQWRWLEGWFMIQM